MDNEGERAASWSTDVEMIERNNDSMVRNDKTMILLNVIDLANANAMASKQFRVMAEAHTSNETMKNQWNFRLNDTESCMWNDDSWKRGIGSMTSMAARS